MIDARRSRETSCGSAGPRSLRITFPPRGRGSPVVRPHQAPFGPLREHPWTRSSVREILAADYDLYFSNWKAAEGAGKQSQVEAIRSNLLCRRPLQVFETCTGTIGEFESWKNAMNTKGELLAGDDKYEDSGNDSMDALGGIIADNPTFKQARSEVVKSG